MTKIGFRTAYRGATRVVAVLACVLLASGIAPRGASAQPGSATATPAPASASVVINLIRLLVQGGVLATQ